LKLYKWRCLWLVLLQKNALNVDIKLLFYGISFKLGFPLKLISSDFSLELRFDFRQNYWSKLSKVIGILILILTVEIKIPISNQNRIFYLFWWKMIWNFGIWIEMLYRNRNSDVRIEIPILNPNHNRNSDVEIKTKIKILISTSKPKSKFWFGHQNFDKISLEFCRNIDFVNSKQSKSKNQIKILISTSKSKFQEIKILTKLVYNFAGISISLKVNKPLSWKPYLKLLFKVTMQ
jgi:hypothetical protein